MPNTSNSLHKNAVRKDAVRKDAARPWLFGALFVWTLTGAVAWAAYSSRAVPVSPAVLRPDLREIKAPVTQKSTTVEGKSANTKKVEGIVWEPTFEGAMQRARTENLPLMIDFYTDWCGWCKELDRQVFPAKAVVEESKKWVSIRINAEKRPDVAGAYGVTGYPTIIFAQKNGVPLSTLPGFAPVPEFVAAMKAAHAKIP